MTPAQPSKARMDLRRRRPKSKAAGLNASAGLQELGLTAHQAKLLAKKFNYATVADAKEWNDEDIATIATYLAVAPPTVRRWREDAKLRAKKAA